MFIAFAVLLGLVSLCPAILTVEGAVLPCLIPLLVAIGLVAASLRLPTGEAQRLANLIRPFIIPAAIPALWMLLQMLPLPLWRIQPWSLISGLAHPVWASVAAGFPGGDGGSITVDIGATAIALAHYLSFVGVIILATAVAINRDRAESVLVSVTAATVLIALVVAYADLFGVGPFAARDEALNCACLGVILSAACASLVFERREARRTKPERRGSRPSLALLTCLAAFLICAGAVVAARSGSLLFAASCGLALFGAVVLVRRLDLGRWGAAAIAVTAIVIASALVTGAAGNSSDPRLAFVKKNAASIELTQRILADAPFLGDGAGTFDAMLPIYQSADPAAADSKAVTAAAKLSIEMGRPILWLAVIAAAITTLVLLRGAAKRGRDSFYPTAGAACLVTLTVLAFVNVGVFGAALPSLAGVILGLGLAQSKGRVSP
jgi:hypothetical protein